MLNFIWLFIFVINEYNLQFYILNDAFKVLIIMSISCLNIRLPQCLHVLKQELTVTNTVTIVCIASYALTIIMGQNLLSQGALDVSKVLQGQVWRIVTYPILHLNILHLISNIHGLRTIGPLIEKRWGAPGFAKIAALSIAADIMAKAVFQREGGSVGLSGVLYGMIGATTSF